MIENSIKSCSFFGYRNIKITEELKQNIKEVVEDLIINHNAKKHVLTKTIHLI